MRLFCKALFNLCIPGMIMCSLTGTAYAAAANECNIQQGSCIQTTKDGMTVELDILPKPVTAMSALTFTVTLHRQGKPVADGTVALDLSMPGMYMGKNSPVLTHVAEGQYEGSGTIVRCMSGRNTWRADVAVSRDGKSETVSFVFEVRQQ
jgi:hypothetical protein